MTMPERVLRMTMAHTIILGSGVRIGVVTTLTPESRESEVNPGLAKLNALQRVPPAAHHSLDKFLDGAYRLGVLRRGTAGYDFLDIARVFAVQVTAQYGSPPSDKREVGRSNRPRPIS